MADRNYIDARDFGAVDGMEDAWPALTEATKAAAGARPVFLPMGHYKLSQPLVFEHGGLIGETPGSIPDDTAVRLSPIVPQAHDVIQVTPPDNGRPFWFRNLNLTSGLRGFYASATVGDRPIWQQSIFDNIRCTGSLQEGFFFDKLWAIGVMFTRIRAENCGGDGIRFSGRTQLNGATIINARSSDNNGAGYRFESTGGQANTPAVGLHGCIAEWNFGPGMHFLGYNASLYDPYFEGNDNDKDGNGPDLMLSSNLSNTIPSQITAVGAYFGPAPHPPPAVPTARIGVGTGGTQQLVLINPKIAVGTIDASKLILEGSGINPTKTATQGRQRRDAGDLLRGWLQSVWEPLRDHDGGFDRHSGEVGQGRRATGASRQPRGGRRAGRELPGPPLHERHGRADLDGRHRHPGVCCRCCWHDHGARQGRAGHLFDIRVLTGLVRSRLRRCRCMGTIQAIGALRCRPEDPA